MFLEPLLNNSEFEIGHFSTVARKQAYLVFLHQLTLPIVAGLSSLHLIHVSGEIILGVDLCHDYFDDGRATATTDAASLDQLLKKIEDSPRFSHSFVE